MQRLRSLPATLGIEEALQSIQSNYFVVASMAAAEPTLFWKNFHHHARSLVNVVVQCANPTQAYPCLVDAEVRHRVAFQMMFLTSAIHRQLMQTNIHYLPQHLSRWVSHLRRNTKIDVFWGSCSPPDRRGFVSLGIGSCYEPEILRMAGKVILEVNPLMPVTFGATTLSLQDVDIIVENSHVLHTLPLATPSPCECTIGGHIAEIVPNGATLQLGIGAIPNAVAQQLRAHKDLGIHTELINDAIFDLIKHGAVTGRCKSIWPEKIVGSFALGSQELYDYLHENPAVEFQPSSVVNDPYRIGRNTAMISVNSAIEIDLTGQVCSESVGHTEVSGVGGASDTHTGAQRSPNGRGIIAMNATTKDGQNSKIVVQLRPGAKVSISRNDVDTVVTEYGIAHLAGRTTAQRVNSLVGIAHPNFRSDLLVEARKYGYL